MSDVLRAAQLLKAAQRIAVLTGAGVSKESGVPTFRDAIDGLWARYDPHQLATAEAFRANPKLVWDWYEYRRGLVGGAKPNPGHVALAQMERLRPHTVIITQNVDDLHEQAGSADVIHLHGNIAQNKCFYNCQGVPTPVDARTCDPHQDGVPACPHCGGWVRPDIVWFGEALPESALQCAIDSARTCDVMLVVGTSGLVHPAALLPGMAHEHGAQVIEVNPDNTPLSRVATLNLRGASGVMLPQVMAEWERAG